MCHAIRDKIFKPMIWEKSTAIRFLKRLTTLKKSEESFTRKYYLSFRLMLRCKTVKYILIYLIQDQEKQKYL